MRQTLLNQTFHLRNCSVGIIRQACADLYFCESASSLKLFPLKEALGLAIFLNGTILPAQNIWGSLVIMRLDDSDPIPPPSKEKIKRVNPTPTYAWAKPRVVDHQRTSHSQKKPKQIRGHVYRLKTINSAVSEWCKKEKQIFIQNQYILFRSSGFTTFTFTNYYPVCY